jgi:hypothetical protein
MPGYTLNLGKSGVSTSLGGRGAWYTVGRGRSRTTLGLPGTGISYKCRLTESEGVTVSRMVA